MPISTSGISVPQLGQTIDSSIYGNQNAPKPMTIGDMLDISGKSLDIQKKKALLQSEIETGQATAKKATTEANKAQFGFTNDQGIVAQNEAARLLKDPRIKDAQNTPEGREGSLRALDEVADTLKTKGLHDDVIKGMLGQYYTQAIHDPTQIAPKIDQGLSVATGAATQRQQLTPQYTTNAAGQIVGLTSGTNQISQPSSGQGGQNLSPSTPSVQNFGDYQKDLSNRVAAGTQIDMRLNEAEDLMKTFKPGAGARTYVDLAQKLQAIGAPQDLVDKVAKGDLSAAQSMNKFIAQSITAGIGQMQGNPTANMMNDYLKNNPDIASDPRALQRFFNFAHKQNEMAYEEQNYLTNKIKNKELNPETHVAETQQHILNKFVRPQGTKEQSNRQVVRTGKTKSGQKVVEYSDGTREIQ